jgi:hypothetical protein
MVTAKAMQFGGPCQGCGRDSENARNAVEVNDGENETWLCAKCARALARKLVIAADVAESNSKSGLVYRRDRWVKRGTVLSPGVVAD